MATILLRLDERTTKENMNQVRIRINHHSTTSYLPTGIWVEPQYFRDDSLYDPINRKAQQADYKREHICDLVRRCEEAIFSLQHNEPDIYARMSASDIRERVRGGAPMRTHETKKVTNADADFMDALDKYGQSRTSENTKRHYAYVWRVLYGYLREHNMKTMRFSDITYERLENIARWLRDTGRGEVTRYKVESYIRSVYRDAEKRHIISRENDPFFDYSIKPVPLGEIKVASAETIRKMLALDLTRYPGLSRVRDILMMSFYLCGANLIDLYDMQEAVDGEVVFIRHKMLGRTRRPVHIKVEPELQALIDKHQGHDGYLLDFREHAPFSNYQWKVCKLARKLSGMLGEKVDMEIIRRSYASIAAEIDVPDRVIDKSMGHVDKTIKDRHYEQYDWGRTAKHNRRVMDYILKNEE